MKKTVSGIMLALLLIGMLTLAINTQPAKTSPTTIIVPDDYPTIQEAIGAANQGDTIFVKQGTYYEHVVMDKTVSLFGENKETTIIDGSWVGTVLEVAADNITIMGFTIRNSGSWSYYSGMVLNQVRNCNVSGNNIVNNWIGVRLYFASHNIISGNEITNNWDSFWLNSSSYNNIAGNNIAGNTDGVDLYSSSHHNIIAGNNIGSNWISVRLYSSSNYNSVIGNNIASCTYGIIIATSSNNFISGNNIANNERGVCFDSSSENRIFNNNFVQNQQDTYFSTMCSNWWNDDYPSGGNYWSGYVGVDIKSGSDQNLPGSDGIGDTTYIKVPVCDHYPLMGTFSDFSATSEHHVQTICNSSISDFHFNGSAIIFNVSGKAGTIGFCRPCIPTSLISSPFKVYVDGTEISYSLLQCSNSTQSYLYFTYGHSTHRIVITSELPVPPIITATIDLNPDALNLRSKGKWITAYIELPEGYDVHDVNVSSIMLSGSISAESKPKTIGDCDSDGIPDLMVKFDREAVVDLILANYQFSNRFGTVTFTITGHFYDGTPFSGSDTIKIVFRMPKYETCIE